MGELKSDQWQGCYDDGWQGDIVPEAFSHPAKFSRGLIHRIYQHTKEMGWVKPGDYILDPFGGVALGGLDALSMGLNWIGVELEEKFVTLGQQNIELWNRQLKGWPNLGTARIVQGDSRYLRDIIFKGDLIISSPNFPTDQPCPSQTMAKKNYHAFTRGDGTKRDHEMRSNGNLGSMKEGKFDAVISSPPYAEGLGHGMNKVRDIDIKKGLVSLAQSNYGKSKGQLNQMPEGSFDMCVSSPPYEGTPIQQTHMTSNKRGDPNNPNYRPSWKKKLSEGYANTKRPYGNNSSQLGETSGDTFWSASHEIVQQCYELLKPGGHAIWVCKDYVKNKQRVPFSNRWLALCESVGFKLVCRHQSMLVKEHGTQITINGEEKITTERKSFFRRLAESKGSPRIDWEDILCLVKQNA